MMYPFKISHGRFLIIRTYKNGGSPFSSHVLSKRDT